MSGPADMRRRRRGSGAGPWGPLLEPEDRVRLAAEWRKVRAGQRPGFAGAPHRAARWLRRCGL